MQYEPSEATEQQQQQQPTRRYPLRPKVDGELGLTAFGRGLFDLEATKQSAVDTPPNGACVRASVPPDADAAPTRVRVRVQVSTRPS